LSTTRDPAGILSKFTGLSRDEIGDVWKQAKDNAQRLEACPGPHVFVRLGPGLNSRSRCISCGGDVDWQAAQWYQRGLEHGRRG